MSKSQINLRGDTSLKEKLSEIAKQKGTSLNDIAIQVLADFAENYSLEQVQDDEIPSAEQIKKKIQAAKDGLKQSYKNGIKVELGRMAGEATDTIDTDIFCANEVSYELRKEICYKIKEELEDLGYYVYVYIYEAEMNSIYRFRPLSLVISLDPEMPSKHQEIEDAHGWEEIPF